MEEDNKTKQFFDNIQFINEEEVKNLNFYEACLYLEKLNVLDNATQEIGDDNE